MRKMNLEQKRWVLVSGLLVALGFSFSAHQYERDVRGFAAIKGSHLQPTRNISAASGVIDLASKACDQDSQSKECEDETKAAVAQLSEDISKARAKLSELSKKSESAQKEFDAIKADKNSNKTDKDIALRSLDRAQAAKEEQEVKIQKMNSDLKSLREKQEKKSTQATLSYWDPDCNCQKSTTLDRDAIASLIKALEAKKPADSGNSEGSEKSQKSDKGDKPKKAGDDKARIADQNRDEGDEVETPSEKKLREERSARRELAEKRKAFKEKIFARILDECAGESDKTDDVACRSKGFIDLIKENNDRIKEKNKLAKESKANMNEIKKMEVRILSENDLKEFYLKNIKPELISFLNVSEKDKDKDQKDTQKELIAGAKIAQKLESEIPKELESIRADLINSTIKVVENYGALAQIAKKQQNQWVAAQKKINPNYENEKFLDPTFTQLANQISDQTQLTNYMSNLMERNNRYSLAVAYTKGNIELPQANQYMNQYLQNMTRISNGLVNPNDGRYQLAVIDSTTGQLQMLNSQGGTNVQSIMDSLPSSTLPLLNSSPNQSAGTPAVVTMQSGQHTISNSNALRVRAANQGGTNGGNNGVAATAGNNGVAATAGNNGVAATAAGGVTVLTPNGATTGINKTTSLMPNPNFVIVNTNGTTGVGGTGASNGQVVGNSPQQNQGGSNASSPASGSGGVKRMANPGSLGM